MVLPGRQSGHRVLWPSPWVIQPAVGLTRVAVRVAMQRELVAVPARAGDFSAIVAWRTALAHSISYEMTLRHGLPQ